MTAYGYARVSTEEQAEHGAGLDIQADAITATAVELNLPLAEIYRDEGISGSNGLDARVGLGNVMDVLAEHDTLIIYRLDRLARDLIIQEQILAEIWQSGSAVVPCSPSERIYCQPDNPDDPSRALIRQMLGAVAAYERAMIRLRMSRGRRRALAERGYAGGPEPYGYTDEHEQALLADVTIARAAAFTWREITVMLNGTHRPKRNGQPWTAAEIHRVWHRHHDRTTPLSPVLL